MIMNDIRVIGVMSGTSLDGVDLVFVRFDSNDFSRFVIECSETVSYSLLWKEELQEAINYSDEKLALLDKEYGIFLGETINTFLNKNAIENIDFIASHGHTIRHQPDEGITLQIGNGKEIAAVTQQKVVCDFRTQDVALGGQGAPLVPIGDKLLFSVYDYCVNLGGFANVSYDQEGSRIAFDICPVNIVLNHYTRKLGLEYDDKGALAASGTINQELLLLLNELPFYKKMPPKSLGLEWVKEHVLPLIDKNETDIPTILRTFVEHVAIQMNAIMIPSKTKLFTGGGVFNAFLMKRIAFYLNERVGLVGKQLIEYKEALVFAFLGVLRVHDEVNCLASVTGAANDHSSGKIYLPD